MFVLDASMALSWIFPRSRAEESSLAEQVLSRFTAESAIVPPLWHTEIVNGLLAAERRKAVSRAETLDYLARLTRLPITTDDLPVTSRRDMVMSLARDYSLTAYDATYLDLALRLSAKIASFDQALLSAVERAGGTTF